MERQKVIVYQMDLFNEQNMNSISHSQGSQSVTETIARKGLQMTEAGEQKRALTDNLMQFICSSENILKAYKQVKQNDGSPGTDKQDVKSFADWYIISGEELKHQLKTGKYKPDPVKSVEILKPDGKGKRQLGIPTVKDRVILRSYRLKLCKKVYTLKLFLSHLGAKECEAWNVARSGKGWWRLSKAPPVSRAMGIKWFNDLGLYSLALNYDKLNN
jgi:retron-type reverse transcriptase